MDQKEPWIPAPGKTSLKNKNMKFSWNSPKARLHCEVRRPKSAPSRDDVITEDDIRLRLEDYERRIDKLMSEKQVTSSPKATLQEAEMTSLSRQLADSQLENRVLRHNLSMTNLNNQSHDSTDALLRQLVSMETEGVEICKMLERHRNVIDRMNDCDDVIELQTIEQTRHQLLRKIEDYDVTNRALRERLYAECKKQRCLSRAEKSRDYYFDQSTVAEARNSLLSDKIAEQKLRIDELVHQLEEERTSSRQLVELNKAVEGTRAHLQRQLRHRDMTNSRLQIQLKNVEKSAKDARCAAERDLAAVEETRKTLTRDREALKRQRETVKRAASVSRDRVSKLEEQLCAIRCKLQDREKTIDQLREKCKRANEKREEEVKEMTSKFEKELKGRRDVESRVDELMMKVNKLEEEKKKLKKDLESDEKEGIEEMERVRKLMMEKLEELNPLPEVLQETELKLHHTEQRLYVIEARCAEQNRLISDLTNKAEDRTDERESLRQELCRCKEEKRAIQARLEMLMTRSEEDRERRKRNDDDVMSRREEMTQLEIQLSEQKQEAENYKRKLQNLISEYRSSIENEKDKYLARENALQSKMVTLESDLTRSRAEVLEIKRLKEDTERRWTSKYQDICDQLQQSESSVTSMRSYVNFLKTSYNNVFSTSS